VARRQIPAYRSLDCPYAFYLNNNHATYRNLESVVLPPVFRMLQFSSLTFKTPTKNYLKNFLKVHIHQFSKTKSPKEVKNSKNQGFSYYYCLMIEGSGSIPLTSGSGSGRPKTCGSGTLLATRQEFMWEASDGPVWDSRGRPPPPLPGCCTPSSSPVRLCTTRYYSSSTVMSERGTFFMFFYFQSGLKISWIRTSIPKFWRHVVMAPLSTYGYAYRLNDRQSMGTHQR
jgi:hypothetical protein